MEDTTNKLLKSISELPVLQPKDKVWDRIVAELDHSAEAESFLNARSNLPTYNSPLSWTTIVIHLESGESQTLIHAINDLQKLTLEKDLFSKIEFENHFPYPTWKILGIAASISLLFILGFVIWSLLTSPKVEYTYIEEVTPPTTTPFYLPFGQEDEVLEFVNSNCMAYTEKCNETKFIGLLTQYNELQEAELQLVEEIQRNNDSVQLTKYLIRITKEKSEVGKSLINYMLS